MYCKLNCLPKLVGFVYYNIVFHFHRVLLFMFTLNSKDANRLDPVLLSKFVYVDIVCIKFSIISPFCFKNCKNLRVKLSILITITKTHSIS